MTLNQDERKVIKHSIQLISKAYQTQPFLPAEISEARAVLQQLLTKGASSLLR